MMKDERVGAKWKVRRRQLAGWDERTKRKEKLIAERHVDRISEVEAEFIKPKEQLR